MNSKSAQWVERSRTLMAWAVTANEHKATYIGSLQRNQTGLACACICPACGGRLQAVNAGKSLEELPEGKSLRPHFRHDEGQQRDSCLIKMSQIAALELLLQESVIHLPEQTSRRMVTGASGRTYPGEATSAGFSQAIVDRQWVDEHEAKITLSDGRVVWFRLSGAYGRGLESDGDAIITIKVDDPEVSTWPPEKILQHAQLTGNFLCWEKHWDDAELAHKAGLDAEQKAQHWCDLIPPDLELAQGLTNAQKTESLLHWLIKKILEGADAITTPANPETITHVMPDGTTASEPIFWPQTVYRISNVRLEHRLQGVVPDVLCTAVSGQEPPIELMIEVAVTHRVDQAKADRIRAMELACLEIDVQRFGKEGRVTMDELRSMVLTRTESKQWVTHPSIEAKKRVAEQTLEQKQKYRSTATKPSERDARARWVQSLSDEELLYTYLNLLRGNWQFRSPINSYANQYSLAALVDELQERDIKGMDAPVMLAKMGLLWVIESIVMRSASQSAVSLLEHAMSGAGPVSLQKYASVVGMAITTYRVAMAPREMKKFDRLRETMRHSIRSGETTYARPTDYDRTLAILFPALRVRLESGKATQFAVEKINRTKA